MRKVFSSGSNDVSGAFGGVVARLFCYGGGVGVILLAFRARSMNSIAPESYGGRCSGKETYSGSNLVRTQQCEAGN